MFNWRQCETGKQGTYYNCSSYHHLFFFLLFIPLWPSSCFQRDRVWEKVVLFHFYLTFFFLMKWSSLKDSTTYLKTTVLSWNMKNAFSVTCTATFCLLQSVVGWVWSSGVRLPVLVLTLSFTSWATLNNQWNPHVSVSSRKKWDIDIEC